MEALWVAACPDEAADFFAFMTTAAASSLGPGHGLQIMFGVGGEHDLTERELPHLQGWRDSRPVRVGNGAWNQRQIDVYGELLGAAHRLADQLDEHRRRHPAVPRRLRRRRGRRTGREKDQGIWEVRGEPQHFLYSKVMCWVALDRAIALAEPLGARGPRRRLEAHPRGDLGDASSATGWSDEAGAFTQYVRLDRAGRVQPDDGDRRLPAGRRPADAGHDRRDRGTADRRPRAGLPLPHRRTASTGSPARRARSCSAPSGWPRRWPWPARSTGPARSSSGPPRFVNDVGLLAEEVDAASPASCSATSRRPSATSGWSTRPGRSRGRGTGVLVEVRVAERRGASSAASGQRGRLRCAASVSSRQGTPNAGATTLLRRAVFARPPGTRAWSRRKDVVMRRHHRIVVPPLPLSAVPGAGTGAR